MKSNVSRVEALCQRENMFLFDKIAIRIDSIIYFLFYYWNLSNPFVTESLDRLQFSGHQYVADKLMRTAGSRILIIASQKHA